MGRIFALADCNNFYVSCERALDPALDNQPVVVLSSNDGCIISRSAEAKRMGIPMGVPLHQVKPLLRSRGVRYFSSNFELYNYFSCRVMEVLREFTPSLEHYSIDEAFLDLTERKAPLAYSQLIISAVWETLRIPLSIGVAETKTLAKIANRQAKTNPENGGIYSLAGCESINTLLAGIPVEEVWGIGRRWAEKLRRYGVHTALELKRMEEQVVTQRFNVILLRTVLELQGISCLDIESSPPPAKSVIFSQSFGRPIRTLPELQQATATFTGNAARKLRLENAIAGNIGIWIASNKHKQWEPQYRNYQERYLPVATNSTAELTRYALELLTDIFRPNITYYKAGVILSSLVPATAIQQSLFDTAPREKWERLTATLDQLNDAYGQGTVQYAIESFDKPWKARQAHCSEAGLAYMRQLREQGMLGPKTRLRFTQG